MATMKMVSMKLSPAKSKAKTAEVAPLMGGPRYPWGLELTLDEDVLAKLKLEELPEAGETVMIHAQAKVTRVSSTDNVDGGKSRSVTLQITDLCCLMEGEEMDDEDDADEKSTRLYKGKKKG